MNITYSYSYNYICGKLFMCIIYVAGLKKWNILNMVEKEKEIRECEKDMQESV